MVGDIEKINTEWLQIFIEKNIVPVISSISQSNDFELLNTNADTIASNLSIGMAKHYDVNLFFYFDKPGVLKDSNNDKSLIRELNIVELDKMKKDKSIHTGMLPKLDNGFFALKNGVAEVQLGNKMDSGTKLYI
jgi:acetylglutamate kinase